MRWIVIVGCWLIAAQGFAQYRPYPYRENWYEGTLIHKNGDTLSGKLQFDWETNSLKFKTTQDPTIKTFSASNVPLFEFFDPTWRYTRQFESFLYAKRGDYGVPTFFEVIQPGAVAVLLRENDNNSVVLNVKKLSKAAFECYFGYSDGLVQRYDGLPRNLFRLLPNHQDKIKKFIEMKQLDYANLADITRIVTYYNSLEKSVE
ncbi:MAG: hypothetical protein U0Y10_07935 [Spirosomataceae bacterium]